MLRVLIVDDSALMRRQLRKLLEAEDDIEVVQARSGVEALEQLARHAPQVVTLDVNMPDMDGLACLERIMREAPRPVVMVSSATAAGSDATVRALALGAVDVVLKPGSAGVPSGIERLQAELLAKVRAAAAARPRRMRGLRENLRAERALGERRRAELRDQSRQSLGLTLIGVSTGGPRVLEEVLPALPPDYPQAIVIAQHMPRAFTASLAQRLNGLCALPVAEVGQPTPLRAGHIYIARGEADIVLEMRLGRLIARSVAADGSPWHPSVSRMVSSALAVVPAASMIGVQLTGMGDDGAQEMALLHQRGGRTIAEAEESAVVFGMPGELVRRGGATAILPCDRIATQLRQWTGTERRSWPC
ncbi:chemotaxis-specific protein-glutamate methyltransferase CheB [Roseomonas sp. USHLN139]|uniref:chemotaxis-specific protein-glutamate methyltransferase CheB n=1 Tax=Roseomonas sp. USHLN139 TaxID=3081298 RepID=UPI003B026CAF